LKTLADAVEPADAVEVAEDTEDAEDAEEEEATEEEDLTGNVTTMATLVTFPEIVFFQEEELTLILKRIKKWGSKERRARPSLALTTEPCGDRKDTRTSVLVHLRMEP